MEAFFIIAGVIAGTLMGAVGVFLLYREKVRDAYEKGKLEAENESLSVTERLANSEKRLEELKDQIKQVEEENLKLDSELKEELTRRSAAEEKNLQIPKLVEQLNEKEASLDELNQETAKLKSTVATLETTLNEERKQAEEKFKLLESAKENLSIEFKNLANKLFDESSRKFKEQNKASLEVLLNPLGEKIQNFEKKVQDNYEKGVKDRSSLIEKITQLQELNQQLSTEASNLTNALKGEVKTQGNWGELILEKVLEASGLRKGIEYDVQVSVSDEDGKRFQPDVILNLPEEKQVIIDSKVSLTAYEKIASLLDPEEQKSALAEHMLSINKHVKELFDKDYQSLYQIKSLDFVLMFVPIEPAFTVAVQEDSNLYVNALNKNIVIVTPSTLLATLRTIAHIWKQEYQNKNAAEIAKKGGDLYDKFNRFVQDLEDVGNRLNQTHKSYENAMNKLTTGRGNLVRRAEEIRKLGARVKAKIADHLVEDATDEASDDDFKLMAATED